MLLLLLLPLRDHATKSCAVLGKKRVEFRGKKRLHYLWEQLSNFVEQLNQIERDIGTQEYNKRVREMKENLKITNSQNIKEEHKQAYQAVLSQIHCPSAKELERGTDIAPMIAWKLQYGKIHTKVASNRV